MANQRLIYGFHAVNARLWQNPNSLTDLYVQEGRQDARMREVLEKAAAKNVRVHFADAERLASLCKNARHQGVVALLMPRATMCIWKTFWKTSTSRRFCWCSTASPTRTTSAPACAWPTPWACMR